MAFPWATLAITFLTLAFHFWDGAVRGAAIERDRILAGELWRIWTGHLVHFGGSHLLWNLLVVAVSGIWAEQLWPARTRMYFLFGPILITATLIVGNPRLAVYGGLSGIGAGLLALLALASLQQSGARRRWCWWAVLALLALKLTIEIATERPFLTTFSESNIRTVPLAHAAGIVAAIGVHCFGRRGLAAPGHPLRRDRP